MVEDEPVVRKLIVELLGDLGYRVLEADDGPSGLAILQSDQRVDLLITDVGLPGLNGRQIADAARPARPGLKVLFMTGYAENAMPSNDYLAQGMDLITKPFPMDVLAQRLRKIMAR
ncbi:response regulator [Nitrospirillum viridazoti]|uniref:response regulator n=1 Tax=Nitrospirillum viridazoti TaxID=3144925 RepID=UPI003F70B5E9